LFYGFIPKPVLPAEQLKARDSGMNSKIMKIRTFRFLVVQQIPRLNRKSLLINRGFHIHY